MTYTFTIKPNKSLEDAAFRFKVLYCLQMIKIHGNQEAAAIAMSIHQATISNLFAKARKQGMKGVPRLYERHKIRESCVLGKWPSLARKIAKLPVGSSLDVPDYHAEGIALLRDRIRATDAGRWLKFSVRALPTGGIRITRTGTRTR